MKKIAILCIILFLASCTTTSTGTVKEDYRTGTEALAIAFETNQPPTKQYDTEGFNVLLSIKNKGAADVGGPMDKIYLSGFDPQIITGIPTTGKNIQHLKGKDAFRPQQGDENALAFTGTISRLRTDSYPVRIMATACYQYETIASPIVCVDPSPFDTTTREKPCTPTNVALSSQGAPVSVTAVEVEPRPGKTGLRIKIKNVGGGDAFKAEALQKCNPYDQKGLEYSEIDHVLLADISIGGQSITQTCRPLENGYIRLTNGAGEVYCDYAPIGNTAYSTPLTINLKYGYRTYLYKNIEIIKTP